jgi:ABC-type branched-subunit amino acid transport system substrate-binding protein
MRRAFIGVIVLLLSMGVHAQEASTCSCGSTPQGRPTNRSMKPYAQEPEDLRPFSKFTTPYYEHYTDLIEYNGAARDLPVPDLDELTEIRIGFIGPISNHPDEVFGRRMLNGTQMAIDEANARGGYCGKPFKLMLHNDSAVWGASSNEVVKMVYDDKVWAMFGSISGDTTHIALRVALRAEVPLISSAATDPTIPETLIPWFLTDLQDDRVQGYTLARHIYTALGLKRVAILRVNDRYGRFGVLKFRDASRRLGHPVVIEQKYTPGDTDFRRQLRVINGERTDGIVLWTNQAQAAVILKQMRELGMNQRVFGSHRTIGDELLAQAGDAAEGFEAVFPYDPSRTDAPWTSFNARFEAKYNEKPDQFASLAYDAMQVLLRAICRAGLNRARIRDALTATTNYSGVTGEMVFDPNCKNISPMFLATVRNGRISYRPATMEKPYAQVGEGGVEFHAPPNDSPNTGDLRLAVFGSKADEVLKASDVVRLTNSLASGYRRISLIGIPSEQSWGKASKQLVDAVYNDHVVGIIALDRNSAHLTEQIAIKSFLPVVALSADRTLTSINIPWIFRLPPDAGFEQALRCFSDAAQKAGSNPEKIRAVLASGLPVGGLRFESTGELK